MLSSKQLEQLCEQYQLRPSKQYGQNYLVVEKPIEKMIEVAGLTSDDTVVEVGPGFGVLTFALLKNAKHVVAFEIEKKLEEYWEEQKKNYHNLEVIWGNALHKLKECSPSFLDYSVVANVPYQISSEIIRTVLELENKPKRVVMMLQKEVVERICAEPGDMSVLAVSVQYYGVPKKEMLVPNTYFWPSPKVDSAILSIELPAEQPTQEEAKHFFRFVKAGFATKRKQLKKQLVSALRINETELIQVLADLGHPATARAQELSIDDWKTIANHFSLTL